MLLLGTFAPSLVALWLTAWAEGGKGASVLLRRVFEWRVALRWYVFAVVYMAAIKLAVALTHRIIAGTWPTFGHELPGIIVIAIIISTPAQAGEEIGWRGYALPRLAARWGFGGASVVVGLFWACWHLPLFFLPGADKYGQSFPLFLLGTTALSVAIAWLYVHTNGSLLLTMLMHSAMNQTIGIIPDTLANATNPFALRASPEFLLTVTFLWITAAYFLVRMPKAELLRIRRKA
ncbi:MAG TPA: CPBP family intramembrane glutamic endopeptidase [Candidatus Acidoferrales bacterium]|nr:CPBP family intramembrane glutamic endopeptidase [Candidatus Acidoferrales bacterium]